MTRLKDVAILNRQALPENTDADRLFRYLDIGSVDSVGRITDAEELRFEAAPSRARRLVQPGDSIVSTVRTYLRAIAHIEGATDDLVVSTGFTTLSPRPGVDPRFLFWTIRGSEFIEDVVARSVGVSYPAITATELGTLPVPQLTLDEQRRIADYLDAESARIDEFIAEQEHLVVLLLERREAELDGWIEHGGCRTALREVSSPWVDSVPSGWELTPLKRCAERVMVGIVINPSAYYEAEGVPVLRGLNVRPGRVSSEDLVFMSHGSNELHRKSILQAGDIVVVRTGIAGSAAQVPSWAVGGNAVDLLIVRPGDRLVPGFLELVLNSRVVQRQVHYGSVGALQSHFNTASLANVVLPLPPLGDQLRVLEHLRCSLGWYDALIAEARIQIRHLRERRQTLITTAVTQGLDSLPGMA